MRVRVCVSVSGGVRRACVCVPDCLAAKLSGSCESQQRSRDVWSCSRIRPSSRTPVNGRLPSWLTRLGLGLGVDGGVVPQAVDRVIVWSCQLLWTYRDPPACSSSMGRVDGDGAPPRVGWCNGTWTGLTRRTLCRLRPQNDAASQPRVTKKLHIASAEMIERRAVSIDVIVSAVA